MAKKKLIAPCIHMNGTGETDLLDCLESAYTAVQDALDRLRHCTPNARDYYVYGDPATFNHARDEHHARGLRLKGVVDELQALAIAIQDKEKFATIEVDE